MILRSGLQTAEVLAKVLEACDSAVFLPSCYNSRADLLIDLEECYLIIMDCDRDEAIRVVAKRVQENGGSPKERAAFAVVLEMMGGGPDYDQS